MSYNRPTVEPTEKPGSLDGIEYNHPAFGAISASRVTGGHTVLHGSDFQHNGYVEIRICHASLNRTLNRDWHHAEKEIISVMLSEAQWATFVSTLNTASGTPCTIDHINHEPMPLIPYKNEKMKANHDFDKKAKELSARLKEVRAQIQEEISGLSKVKQERILAALHMAEREVGSNMPFMAKCFSEHLEDTVESAKVEVEAYMHGRIMQAGLSLLTNGELPLLLENKDKE